MDARAENRGRPRQKMRFPAAPITGRNFLTQGRKGQECPRELRAKNFVFMLPLITVDTAIKSANPTGDGNKGTAKNLS